MLFRSLLDRGVAIDATTDEKWTALHYAAKWGRTEVVKVLLDRGATINAPNAKGRTALLEACAFVLWSAGRIGVVKVLLERGTSTSIIDVVDISGDTALHCAARCCNAEMVQLLLDNGANNSWKNGNRQTALDIARQLGWERGVTLLA